MFSNTMRPLYAPPCHKDGDDRAKQQDRRLHVAQLEGAVQVVRHGRAHGRGGDHHGPIGERLITPGSDLEGQRDGEEREKYQAADRIPQVQGHRQCVAAGLAHGGREDLDDPERQRHLRDLAGLYAVPGLS